MRLRRRTNVPRPGTHRERRSPSARNPLVEDRPARSSATCPAASRRSASASGERSSPSATCRASIRRSSNSSRDAHPLAAVAGLDGEALRPGILLKAERRVAPRAGEDGRRDAAPASAAGTGRPAGAHARSIRRSGTDRSPRPGSSSDAPGTGRVRLAGRGRLVALGDAMQEGRRKRVGEGRGKLV